MQARYEQKLQTLRDEMSQRDLDAALNAERESEERDRLLRVYGFADVGIRRNTTPESALVASTFPSATSFYLGRLNLYFDSHLDRDFRFLGETRLSLYPNGAFAGTDSMGRIVRTSTAVSDASGSNPLATVSWGSIILERAALDWTRYPMFSVRAGLFFTPFGMYTTDHGTPALLSLGLPFYVQLNWIPNRQLGLQVFGSMPVERWELGYAATVGNGQTSNVVDVGDSKAFGGKLFARRQGELRLLFQASALYQPWREQREQYGFDANGELTFSRTLAVEATSTTLGVDALLERGGLQVSSTFVYFRKEYTPGKRESTPQSMGGLWPDERNIAWNAVLGYRWRMLQPYLLFDFFHTFVGHPLGTDIFVTGVGLNIYFRPNVILKGAWFAPRFYRDNDPDHIAARQNFQSFNLVLTWAF
jgi:hypothetical protein